MKSIYLLISFCYLIEGSFSKYDSSFNSVIITKKIPKYAKGFIVDKRENYNILTLKNSNPNSKKVYQYLLLPRGNKIPDDQKHIPIIRTPINRIIATSTTHIAFLEELDALEKVVGFPQTKYISSLNAQKLIEQKKIIDVGQNNQLNIERIIELEPELILSFSIENEGGTFNRLNTLGVSTLFIGEWNEQDPLGRTEWIKVFGALLGKEKKASTFFETIEKEYEKAKKLASKIEQKPTIVAGAIYQDIWYLPGGKSYLSALFRDANATYLWNDNKQTGSQKLSVEVVFNKGQNADYWFSPAQHTSYPILAKEHTLYSKFTAVKNKKVFTYAQTTAKSNGVSFFESGTCHPELILKDLIYYLHPEVKISHTPTYFLPLND